LCRSRVCNSPEPRNGGKACNENLSIEIANCQVDGSWTDWSAWSACQGNCDSTQRVRTRTRTCTNPTPKNNGRLCVGPDQEEETCTQEMMNPCISKNQNQWFAWGAWTQCSKSCGEGFQMRKRVCNGKNCVGCNQEWQTCNSEPCQGKNETGKWELIEANAVSKQSLEKRFRVSCKFDTVSNEELQLNITREYKLCDNLNASCRTFGNKSINF
jgi:semaphorin 5